VRGNIISIDNTIEEGTRLAVFEPNQRSQGMSRTRRSDAGVRQAVRHATAPDRPELLTVRSVCSFRRADKVAL
jgi:predicted RNA-binding protein with PUA domain